MSVLYYGPDPEDIEKILMKIHRILIEESNDIIITQVIDGKPQPKCFSYEGYDYEFYGLNLFRIVQTNSDEGIEIDFKTDKTTCRSKELMLEICKYLGFDTPNESRL